MVFCLVFFALLWKVGNASPPSPQLPTPNSQLSTLNSQLSTLNSQHSSNAYTNHAGNAIAGWPVKLTAKQVTLAECIPDSQLSTLNSQLSTTTYPLSIFPESEQRRIAADFLLRQTDGSPETARPTAGQVGLLRVPVAVKRAIAGAEKAMARSRKRAEKGLCTKEESDAFCAKSEAALKSYLDKQVSSGTITPAERKALGR